MKRIAELLRPLHDTNETVKCPRCFITATGCEQIVDLFGYRTRCGYIESQWCCRKCRSDYKWVIRGCKKCGKKGCKTYEGLYCSGKCKKEYMIIKEKELYVFYKRYKREIDIMYDTIVKDMYKIHGIQRGSVSDSRVKQDAQANQGKN